MRALIQIHRRDRIHKKPEYKTEGAAGADLVAAIKEPINIPRGGIARIPTGVAIALPHGLEAQVRPRSSMTFKGLIMPTGTIDSDYRGEIEVCIINLGAEPYQVLPDDRIAQLVIAPVVQADWFEVEEASDLGSTSRGKGGYGSTGR